MPSDVLTSRDQKPRTCACAAACAAAAAAVAACAAAAAAAADVMAAIELRYGDGYWG